MARPAFDYIEFNSPNTRGDVESPVYFIIPPDVPPELNDPTKPRLNSPATFSQPMFQHQQYYHKVFDPRFLGLPCALASWAMLLITHTILNPEEDPEAMLPALLVAISWALLTFIAMEIISLIVICCFFPLCSQRPNNNRDIHFPPLTSKRFDTICLVLVGLRALLLFGAFSSYLVLNATSKETYSGWSWVCIFVIGIYAFVTGRHTFLSLRGWYYSYHVPTERSIDAIIGTDPTLSRAGASRSDPERGVNHVALIEESQNEWVNVVYNYVFDKNECQRQSFAGKMGNRY